MSVLTIPPHRRRAPYVIRILKKLFPRATIALKFSNNWELLVAVILSAQCTDKKVNEVTQKLFKRYRKLDEYVKADPRKFEQEVRQTGFYHNKAKNILASARIVKQQHDGKMPQTMEELIALPGVGRKTANVVLGVAFNKVEGIVVDTHVRRLSRLLGWTKYDDPEKIEQDIMKIIPKKDCLNISFLLIEYGRKYCSARPHSHAKCPLVKYYI